MPQDRGKVFIPGEGMMELFKIKHDAAPYGLVSSNKAETAEGYELNLDTLEICAESGILEDIPRIGSKSQELATGFIDYRRANLIALSINDKDKN